MNIVLCSISSWLILCSRIECRLRRFGLSTAMSIGCENSAALAGIVTEDRARGFASKKTASFGCMVEHLQTRETKRTYFNSTFAAPINSSSITSFTIIPTSSKSMRQATNNSLIGSLIGVGSLEKDPPTLSYEHSVRQSRASRSECLNQGSA